MKTLADRIAQDGPVTELDAVGWAIRLAKRLEALHTLGVAHGSVSPACIISNAAERTSKGYLADVQFTTGALAYQSPERIRGGDLSPADDTWAVAATLYTALTASTPFDGANDTEIRQKILAAAPAPLAVYDVGDDDLQQILERAFAREPSARTSTVVALRHALEEWHPDPTVGALLPLDDEDSSTDGEDTDDQATRAHRVPSFVNLRSHDDDDARTLSRNAPKESAPLPVAVTAPKRPPPAARPYEPTALLDISEPEDEEESEDNVRTVMRAVRYDPPTPEARPGRPPAPGPAAWGRSPGPPADPRGFATGPRVPAGLADTAPLGFPMGNVAPPPDKGVARRSPVGFPGADPGGSFGGRSPDPRATGPLPNVAGPWLANSYQPPNAGLPAAPVGGGMAPSPWKTAAAAPVPVPARPRLNRGVVLAALLALIVAALTFAFLRFRASGRIV